MSTDGVLGAAYLPTDGYIDPSQLTFALAEGARRGGAEIYQQHARHRRSRSSAAASPASSPTRARSRPSRRQRRRDVREGDRRARRRQRPDHPDGARVPDHEAVGPADSTCRRCAIPSLLVYFRPESGGLIMGGYERDPAPWSLDGIPADFNGKLLAEDWPRFEELMENALVRVPVARASGGDQADQRPRGVHARRRVHPRPDRGARLLDRGRLLRARARRRGRARASSSPSGSSRGRRRSTRGTWTRAASAAHTARREYTLARTREVYETYYDVKYPGHERQAGRPLRLSPTYPRLAELGAAFGEKSGWERANWFEPNAARGDESLRPRGWAGRLWSPAIGAEHLACRETAALFDETSFAKIEVSGEGAADVPRAALREPGRPRRRRDHLHADAEPARRDRVRLHGHAARRGALPHRHRHGVRPARPGVDPRARAGRRRRRRRHLGVRLPRPLGPGGPRDPAAAHDDARSTSRTCARASSRSARFRASRCA